jgi:hypothetical protein
VVAKPATKEQKVYYAEGFMDGMMACVKCLEATGFLPAPVLEKMKAEVLGMITLKKELQYSLRVQAIKKRVRGMVQ